MTDVSGSNLVIACCPLDFWRNRGRAVGRRVPPLLSSEMPLQTALVQLTVNTVLAKIFAEEATSKADNDIVIDLLGMDKLKLVVVKML